MSKPARKSLVLVAIGYLLSPLSWWNDLFVNLPLSWLIARPFGWISGRLFLPAMVVAYWATNIAGLVLLHLGVAGLNGRRRHESLLRESLSVLGLSALYTALLVALWVRGWLPGPGRILGP